ncbi:MAG: hypothetical protein KKH92_11230 [Firmicutes bacterium]|nr:hypothetical protein [Bacillota bacterium]
MRNYIYLRKFTFIYVDDKFGKDTISIVKKKMGITSDEFFSPFFSDKLYVLSEKFLRGNDVIRYFFDIYLDSNIVSYISRKNNESNAHIKDLVKKITQRRPMTSSVNFSPYITENSLFLQEMPSIVKDNIYDFFRIMYQNHSRYKLLSWWKTKRSMRNIVKDYKHTFESPYSQSLRYKYKIIFIVLLKMSLISFTKKSSKNKLIELIEFQSKKLDFIDIGITELSATFFGDKNSIRFFGKIQAGRSDIVEIVENLTWDIFHFKQLYENMNFQQIKETDVSIPIMCSIDKRFLELKQYMSLQMVAVNKTNGHVIPFYKQKNIKKNLTGEELSKYFNIGKIADKIMISRNIDLHDLEVKLKNEILKTNNNE